MGNDSEMSAEAEAQSPLCKRLAERTSPSHAPPASHASLSLSPSPDHRRQRVRRSGRPAVVAARAQAPLVRVPISRDLESELDDVSTTASEASSDVDGEHVRRGRGARRPELGMLFPSAAETITSSPETLQDVLCGLHADLRRHKLADPFLQPVDVQVFRNYRRFVSSPMDLSAIAASLTSGLYTTPQTYLADVRLVFANSCIYNTDTHSPIFAMTRELSAFFERRVLELGLERDARGIKRKEEQDTEDDCAHAPSPIPHAGGRNEEANISDLATTRKKPRMNKDMSLIPEVPSKQLCGVLNAGVQGQHSSTPDDEEEPMPKPSTIPQKHARRQERKLQLEKWKVWWEREKRELRHTRRMVPEPLPALPTSSPSSVSFSEDITTWMLDDHSDQDSESEKRVAAPAASGAAPAGAAGHADSIKQASDVPKARDHKQNVEV